MNHDIENQRAVNLFFDGMKNPIDKALTGKLTRWELPFKLRHRIVQLTRIVSGGLWCKTNVFTPEPVRLIDVSESDIPDPFWYQWEFQLADNYVDGDERAFEIDIRSESPKTLASHIRSYAEDLAEMADKIEAINW